MPEPKTGLAHVLACPPASNLFAGIFFLARWLSTVTPSFLFSYAVFGMTVVRVSSYIKEIPPTTHPRFIYKKDYSMKKLNMKITFPGGASRPPGPPSRLRTMAVLFGFGVAPQLRGPAGLGRTAPGTSCKGVSFRVLRGVAAERLRGFRVHDLRDLVQRYFF